MKPVDPVDRERDPAWRAAVAWQVTLGSDQVTAAERAGLERWRRADPRHEQAWLAIQALGERLGDPLQVVVPGPSRMRSRPRRRALGSLAALSAAGLGWTAWREARDGPGGQPVHRTATGQTRRVLLPDGSHVTLNTATVLAQSFDAGQRQIRLRSGEILVETPVGDATRPLLIETLAGRLLAQDCRVAVRCFDDAGRSRTRVQVLSGQVRVAPHRLAAVSVTGGEACWFDATAVASRGPLPPDPLAWTRGQLIAAQWPLSRFLAELGRYRPGLLRCDPVVAEWPISGAFPLADTDAALVLVAQTLPIRLRRLSNYWVTVSARAT